MRRRHAPKPAWIGERHRRTRTMAPACRGSFADREARPRGASRRGSPAWLFNVPSSRTAHPRSRARAVDARPDCMAPPAIARPQAGGNREKSCCLPANCMKTNAFSAATPWMQAVVAPALLEVELRLCTADWRESVRLLADGRSDLHCRGVDTGEALPAHLSSSKRPGPSRITPLGPTPGRVRPRDPQWRGQWVWRNSLSAGYRSTALLPVAARPSSPRAEMAFQRHTPPAPVPVLKISGFDLMTALRVHPSGARATKAIRKPSRHPKIRENRQPAAIRRETAHDNRPGFAAGTQGEGRSGRLGRPSPGMEEGTSERFTVAKRACRTGIGGLPTLVRWSTGSAASGRLTLEDGIYGRTLEVRNAIVSVMSAADDCSQVTNAHLAAVSGTLVVSHLTSIRAGDFAGHSGNTELTLGAIPGGVLAQHRVRKRIHWTPYRELGNRSSSPPYEPLAPGATSANLGGFQPPQTCFLNVTGRWNHELWLQAL